MVARSAPNFQSSTGDGPRQGAADLYGAAAFLHLRHCAFAAPQLTPYAAGMSNSERLTRHDWLNAGLNALAQDGPATLRAETLSRKLNTTKGSFYWHFKDVPDFHSAVLGMWTEQACWILKTALPADAPAASRLRELCQQVAQLASSSTAVRGWARDSAQAREALAHIDALSHARISALLIETEVTNPEMARILHAAAIGMAQLPEADENTSNTTIGSLVDLVLALR